MNPARTQKTKQSAFRISPIRQARGKHFALIFHLPFTRPAAAELKCPLINDNSLPGLRPAIVANTTMAELASQGHFGGVGKIVNCPSTLLRMVGSSNHKLKIASEGGLG